MLEENLTAQLEPPPEGAFDADGLTFQASNLNVEDCADVLRERGTALVRGVVPQQLTPAMIDDIEGYFRWLTNGERVHEVALYTNYGNIFLATVADFGDRALMQALHRVSITPISDALYEYFQADRVSMYLGYSFIRRHWRTDTKSISPFHQDGTAVPAPAPMLTCWIPLNPCGVHAPGLEVVAERVDAVLPVTDAPATNHGRMEIDASVVERHYSGSFWQPEFDAGDVLMFDSKCVHRTHVTPTMSGVRYSLEIRFVNTSLARPDWVETQGDLLVNVSRP